MKKQSRIQSIQQFIEIKTKRLSYVRTPYLREYLLQDIADLEQVDGLFLAQKKEIQQQQQHNAEQFTEINKLKYTLLLHGLSEDEMFYYSIIDIEELVRLCKRAYYLGEYKIPQRFQKKNSTNPTNAS
ncbi:MAG: hypothetical protein FWE63_02080 [Bacteroidales bacterium]|nr:hypothetical protein [Bacteroidales bacterium]